jgi:hypothetical protein
MRLALPIILVAACVGSPTFADSMTLNCKKGMSVTYMLAHDPETGDLNYSDPPLVGIHCVDGDNVYVLDIPGSPQFSSFSDLKLTIRFFDMTIRIDRGNDS